jgi:ADP-sugar diphosphatase
VALPGSGRALRNMSAAALPAAHVALASNPRVPVFGGELSSATVAAALASRPFREWAASLDARFAVSSVTLQSVDFFGPRVGFVKLLAEATFAGSRVPGVVFLRGGAVSLLPLLTCGSERWVVCARQPRLAVGAAFLELPAGMLDDGGSFVGVAAKELKEETGIDIEPHELVDLTALAYEGGGSGAPALGVYPSVGACDEFLRLFFFEREVDADFLASLRGKLTGCVEENESIVLELVRYADLWRVPDAKTIASVALLERLVRRGDVVLKCGALE